MNNPDKSYRHFLSALTANAKALRWMTDKKTRNSSDPKPTGLVRLCWLSYARALLTSVAITEQDYFSQRGDFFEYVERLLIDIAYSFGVHARVVERNPQNELPTDEQINRLGARFLRSFGPGLRTAAERWSKAHPLIAEETLTAVDRFRWGVLAATAALRRTVHEEAQRRLAVIAAAASSRQHWMESRHPDWSDRRWQTHTGINHSTITLYRQGHTSQKMLSSRETLALKENIPLSDVPE